MFKVFSIFINVSFMSFFKTVTYSWIVSYHFQIMKHMYFVFQYLNDLRLLRINRVPDETPYKEIHGLDFR